MGGSAAIFGLLKPCQGNEEGTEGAEPIPGTGHKEAVLPVFPGKRENQAAPGMPGEEFGIKERGIWGWSLR